MTKTDNKLSVRHQQFANLILRGENKARSYQAVFPNVSSIEVAAVNANRLLKNPNVSAYLEQKRKKTTQETDAELTTVLKEIARIAFVDPINLFTPEGQPKDINDIDENTRRAISSIEVVEYFEPDAEGKRKQVGWTKKYKFWSKNIAHDQLMRFLAAYKDPGTKDNPLHLLVGKIDFSKLTPQELAQIQRNPEVILSTFN